MSFSPLIRHLIDSLRILPGVGQKTAQRMALQMLERDRSGALRQYRACVAILERELGVVPLADTTARYEAIRDGAGPTAPIPRRWERRVPNDAPRRRHRTPDPSRPSGTKHLGCGQCRFGKNPCSD